MTDVAASIEADQLTLAPRPTPSPEVLAVITAAVQMAWPQPVIVEDEAPPPQTWRFSGRWWNQPTVMRRDRPRSRR